MYRFDYLRNVHFPKDHNQTYKRPPGKGQASISLFQKRSKNDNELGAVGGEAVVMSEMEEPNLSEVDDTCNVQSPRPHSSFELHQHEEEEELESRPQSAPPSFRPMTDQAEINLKILAELEEIKTTLKNVSLNDRCTDDKSNTEIQDDLQELRLKGARSIEEMCSTSNILEITDDGGYIGCIPCTFSLQPKPPGPGYFSIPDLNDGTGQSFSQLKYGILRHIKLSTHIKQIESVKPSKKND